MSTFVRVLSIFLVSVFILNLCGYGEAAPTLRANLRVSPSGEAINQVMRQRRMSATQARRYLDSALSSYPVRKSLRPAGRFSEGFLGKSLWQQQMLRDAGYHVGPISGVLSLGQERSLQAFLSRHPVENGDENSLNALRTAAINQQILKAANERADVRHAIVLVELARPGYGAPSYRASTGGSNKLYEGNSMPQLLRSADAFRKLTSRSSLLIVGLGTDEHERRAAFRASIELAGTANADAPIHVGVADANSSLGPLFEAALELKPGQVPPRDGNGEKFGFKRGKVRQEPNGWFSQLVAIRYFTGRRQRASGNTITIDVTAKTRDLLMQAVSHLERVARVLLGATSNTVARGGIAGRNRRRSPRVAKKERYQYE